MEFFAGANTRYGFKSLFEEAFKDTERLFIIKGSSGCGKSTLMKKIAEKAKSKGLEAHTIYCSADTGSLDGVIVPDAGFAVADGTSPHLLDVKYPAVCESIVNLGEFWDDAKLLPHRAEIKRLTELKSDRYKNAYRALSAAGYTDELINELVLPCIDRKKTDSFAFKLYERLKGKSGREKLLFSKSVCAEGIKTLPVFGNVGTLYRLHGKAASSILRALRQIASEYGSEAIVSLEPVDPSNADSVYFPDTDTLVAASDTLPCLGAKCEKSISSARFINEGRLLESKNRLRGLEKLKKELLNDAQTEFKLAKQLHGEIESIYISAMDFGAMDEYTHSLEKKLFGE